MDELAPRVRNAAQLTSLGDDLRTLNRRRETPVVHVRKELAERVVALLQGGNNVLLRGPSGVGKTCLARSLVEVHWESSRRETGQLQLVETRPSNAPMIIETNAGRFHVGCRYVHDLENKMDIALSTARAKPAIIFIDNVDECIGAGSSSTDPENDVASLLLPHLERGLRVIGSTTPAGEARMREANPRLLGRFTVVDVPEPEAEEALDIARLCLHNIQRKLEEHLTYPAVAEGMALAHHFFPGEAALAAYLRLARAACAAEATLKSQALRRAAAAELGIDRKFVGVGETLSYSATLEQLGSQVLGQDEAVREIADALIRYAAGMNEPGRPLGSFMFAGPSGVGKTSLALAAAEILTGRRDSVLRFDMSEYSSPFSAKRLIEDSPSSLVGQLQTHRAGVVLLDEIEKADPAVVLLLLGALGEARLTSESGCTVRLNHHMVIMTTNVGARRWALGLPEHKITPLVLADVSASFATEFRARLTRTLVFSPISPSIAERVVARELDKLNELPGLIRRNLQALWPDSLVPALAPLGVSRERGARGVQGVVRSTVATPLGRWLLEHPEAEDGIVMIAPHTERGVLISLSIDWVDECGFYRELAN